MATGQRANQNNLVDDIPKVVSGGIDRLPVETTFSQDISDAFSRLKISTPISLFDKSHRNGKFPIYFDEDITGSATSTHNSNKASIIMAVTSATNDEVIRQTRRYFRYFPGKSTGIFLTGNFSSTTAGIRKRIGYFDASDGYFFELDGSTLYAVVRSSVSGSVVETKIAQSSWNVDKLDGTGSSGLTLDVTKQQIFFIDFQWLGSGRVRFGFNIQGRTFIAHEQDHANFQAVPYSQTADLPLRWEIKNVSGSSSDEFQVTCMSIVSDGGDVQQGVVRSFNVGTTEITISTTEQMVMAVRLQSGYTRASFFPVATDLLMTGGNASALWKMYYLPTVTSSSWTNTPGQSITEYAFAPTLSAFSSGYEIASGYMKVGSHLQTGAGMLLYSDLYGSRDLSGTADIFGITVEMISGTGKMLCGMTMREYQ